MKVKEQPLTDGDFSQSNLVNVSGTTDYKNTATGLVYKSNKDGNGAGGRGSIAVGQFATAEGRISTAIGFASYAKGNEWLTSGASTAIGSYATATGTQSLALGSRVRAQGSNSTAIGNDTRAIGVGSLAIGGDDMGVDLLDGNARTGSYTSGKHRGTYSGEAGSTAISVNSQALTKGSTAIGAFATAGHGTSGTPASTGPGQAVIAIFVPDGDAIEATAVGAKAWAYERKTTAIGSDAEAKSQRSTAVGYGAKTTNRTGTWGDSAVVIGGVILKEGNLDTAVPADKAHILNPTASAYQAVAIGGGAISEAQSAVAIGGAHQDEVTSRTQAFANVQQTKASGLNSVAIGAGANAIGKNSIAQGALAQAKDDSVVAIGTSAGVGSSGVESVMIGINAGLNSEAQNSVFLGKGAGQNSKLSLSGHPGAPVLRGHNVGIGHWSLVDSVGEGNTAVGMRAGRAQTGSDNTRLGILAGYLQNGDFNVNAGYFAGANLKGDANINLGQEAGTGGIVADHAINLGVRSMASANNAIAIGSSDVNDATIQTIAAGVNSISMGKGSTSGFANVISPDKYNALSDTHKTYYESEMYIEGGVDKTRYRLKIDAPSVIDAIAIGTNAKAFKAGSIAFVKTLQLTMQML